MEEHKFPETEPHKEIQIPIAEEEHGEEFTPCPVCGNFDFCTLLNSYDIYMIHQGKLTYVKSQLIDEEFKIYCRECGEEFPLTKVT